MTSVIDLIREFGVPDCDSDELINTIDSLAIMLADKYMQSPDRQSDEFPKDAIEPDILDALTLINGMEKEYCYPENSNRIFHWDCIVFVALYRCGMCSESKCREQLKIITDHEKRMTEHLRILKRDHKVRGWVLIVAVTIIVHGIWCALSGSS